VEVVERGRPGPAGELGVAVGDRHVVKAVPPEQHRAGRDVDLEHDAGQRHPAGRAAERRQVSRPRLHRGDQRGVLRGDDELVQVGLQAVASLDGGDGAVGAVGDHRPPVADALVDPPLPPGEHRPAPVCLHLEVHPPLALARREGRVRRVPDDAAVPVQDHQARLAGPGPRVAGRRQDEVARARGVRAGVARDRHRRRGEVGAAHEVQHAAGVIGGCRGGRAGRPGVGPRVPADSGQGQPAGAHDRDRAAAHHLAARQPATSHRLPIEIASRHCRHARLPAWENVQGSPHRAVEMAQNSLNPRVG
jgi:hypothetical protein